MEVQSLIINPIHKYQFNFNRLIVSKRKKMSETAESSKSMLTQYWNGYKEFWGERFSFMNNYSRFLHPDKPLPRHWDSSDVDTFVQLDTVHGPTLKTARKVADFGTVGAVVGAASTAGLAWKWSKSPHGAALSLAFGAVVGGTFGLEVGSHWYQLYRLNPMAAQVKFYEWLQDRAARGEGKY